VKAIAQLVVHIVDLLEAEGRSLLQVVQREGRQVRHSMISLSIALSLLLIMIPLVVAGFGLVAAGLLWWLETMVQRPLAAALTGTVLLGAGGACMASFVLMAKRRAP
jgi:hypothetical protein